MAEKEYIEREALLEIVKRTSGDYAAAWSSIRQLQAADVATVVHGEWKLEWDAEKDPKKYFIRIVCSNCGLKTGEKSNFCPKCGAKMDGKSCVPRTEATP
jgi:hypothetical protein